MEKHIDKNGKTFNKQETTPMDTKPPYQPPVVMPLGELARGWGTGICLPGGDARGQCGSGAGVQGGGQCPNGSGASNCGSGFGGG
jgi:hypothetical protein